MGTIEVNLIRGLMSVIWQKYQARHGHLTRQQQRRIFQIMIIFIGLILVILGLSFNFLRNTTRPSSRQYPVLGVSISDTDGYQDFHLLQQHGVQFVYLKATQGADYFSDRFLDNYWRIQGAQLAVGCYHYFSFSSSAVAQYHNFVGNVGARIGNLPIVLQINNYTDQRPSWKQINRRAKKLQYLLMRHYHRTVILQVDPRDRALLQNQSGGWLNCGPRPVHNLQLDFWQYDTRGKIPSLASTNRYHLSVFNGSQADFNNFIGQSGTH